MPDQGKEATAVFLDRSSSLEGRASSLSRSGIRLYCKEAGLYCKGFGGAAVGGGSWREGTRAGESSASQRMPQAGLVRPCSDTLVENGQLRLRPLGAC